MAQFFAPDRLGAETKKVAVQGPNRTLYFYPSVIEQIKTALEDAGYDTRELQDAMRKFQLDHGIAGQHPFDQIVVLKLLYGS